MLHIDKCWSRRSFRRNDKPLHVLTLHRWGWSSRHQSWYLLRRDLVLSHKTARYWGKLRLNDRGRCPSHRTMRAPTPSLTSLRLLNISSSYGLHPQCDCSPIMRGVIHFLVESKKQALCQRHSLRTRASRQSSQDCDDEKCQNRRINSNHFNSKNTRSNSVSRMNKAYPFKSKIRN